MEAGEILPAKRAVESSLHPTEQAFLMENVTSSTRKLCDLFAAAEVSKANNALIWAIRNVFLRFF